MGGDPRFLFVDRIFSCEPGHSIRAGHRVPATAHPTSGPYRLLEGLAQALGWLLAASTGFQKRGLPISIGSVRLTGPVPVGALMLLEAHILTWRDESAVAVGSASLDGRQIAEVERGLCALIPSDHLDDPEHTRAMFAQLEDRGRPAGRGTAAAFDDGWPARPTFDSIEELEEGRRARADWTIGEAELYFRDHFPRSAIVPGAVQVQAMVELAAGLIGAAAEPDRRLVIEEIREVKFRGLIRPGDRVVLEAGTLSRATERGIATAEGRLSGKQVVSIKEVHFGSGPSAARKHGSRVVPC